MSRTVLVLTVAAHAHGAHAHAARSVSLHSCRSNRGRERECILYVLYGAQVANLTLMALGSSAPEIMLAVIETATTLGKPTPEIGPATIVGAQLQHLWTCEGVPGHAWSMVQHMCRLCSTCGTW